MRAVIRVSVMFLGALALACTGPAGTFTGTFTGDATINGSLTINGEDLFAASMQGLPWIQTYHLSIDPDRIFHRNGK